MDKESPDFSFTKYMYFFIFREERLKKRKWTHLFLFQHGKTDGITKDVQARAGLQRRQSRRLRFTRTARINGSRRASPVPCAGCAEP